MCPINTIIRCSLEVIKQSPAWLKLARPGLQKDDLTAGMSSFS